MKILYNGFCKKSINFKNANPEIESIDWYNDINKRNEYIGDGLPIPSVFPAVVDTENKLILNGVVSIDDAITFFSEQTNKELEIKKNEIRNIRNAYLLQSDSYLLSDFPRGEIAEQDILDYRQSLRDLPGQERFPESVEWPTNPLEG